MSHFSDLRRGDERQLSSPFGVSRDATARVLHPLVVGLVAVFAALVLAYLETRVNQFRLLNIRMEQSAGASGEQTMVLLDPLAYVSITLVGFSSALCVALAMMQERVTAGWCALLVVIGSNMTTQFVKHRVLTQPAEWGLNSLPSGHTTVAASLSVAFVLVVPPTFRTIALAVGGFVATYVGAGTIVGQWHRPADTYAGFLVVLAWTAFSALLMPDVRQRLHLRWRELSSVPLLAATCVGLVFVSLGVRPRDRDVELLIACFTLGVTGLLATFTVLYAGLIATRLLPLDQGESSESLGSASG